MAIVQINAENFPGTVLNGSGTDTLKLVGGGMFDFAFVTFAGFSQIECDSGYISIGGDQLVGVTSVTTSGNYTSLKLVGDNVDVRGKSFGGFNSISVDDNATLTVDSLSLALRFRVFDTQGETIVLAGPVSTPSSRKALHDLGFDTIVEGSTQWTDQAPVMTGLTDGPFHVREGESVLLDPEGDCVLSDAEGRIAYLDIDLSDSGSYYPISNFEFSARFQLINRDYDGQDLLYDGVKIASIGRLYSDSARIAFNSAATSAMIQEFVRTLAYTPGDFVYAENVTLTITARDQGGRKAETVLHITAENDWTPTSPTLSNKEVAENAATGTVVGTLKATDANGDPVSYILTDDAGGRFKIAGDKLVVSGNVPIDYEQATSHSVTVVANDGGQNGIPSKFTIKVTDVLEIVPGLNLSGTQGKDALSGQRGNDTITGGLGNDVLTGAAGADTFKFITKPTRSNIDRITDFAPGLDKIALENAIFKKLGKTGTLKKSFFHVGSDAHDRDDRVIYNSKTGALFYDQDGTGASKAVQFATVTKKLPLKYIDFFVI